MSEELAEPGGEDEPPLISVETLRLALLRGAAQGLLTAVLALAFFVLQVASGWGGSFEWLPRILFVSLAFGFVATPVALVELLGRRLLPTMEWTLQSAALASGAAFLAGGFAMISVSYASAMFSEGTPTAGIEAALNAGGSSPSDWGLSLVRLALGGLVYGLLVALRLREVGLGAQFGLCLALTLFTDAVGWTLIALRHDLIDSMGLLGFSRFAGKLLVQSGVTAAVALPVGWALADALHDRVWPERYVPDFRQEEPAPPDFRP